MKRKMEIYVPGGHFKVRPSMTEQEYFFILSLYSSSTYYMYGITLFQLFISLTHFYNRLSRQ